MPDFELRLRGSPLDGQVLIHEGMPGGVIAPLSGELIRYSSTRERDHEGRQVYAYVPRKVIPWPKRARE